MPTTRPLKVFLCHATADKPAVRKLYQRLLAEGWIDPWLDEEKLSFGQHWTTVIEDALDTADIVLIFLSHNSVQKEGFVQRELNYAWELSLEKPIETIFLIPFRLDDCEVPRRLRSRQWGDYFGEKEESTYQVLLRSLKQRHEQKLRLEAEEQKQRDAIREKAEREAAEKAVREKIERDAREVEKRAVAEKLLLERLERENAEKVAREKAERDEDEKFAREIEERKAAEKTAREKTERDAREKLAREIAERDAEEKAKRETKVEPTVEKLVVTKLPSWGIGLIALVILALIAWGISSISASPGAPQTPSATQTLFVEPGTETPVPVTSTATINPMWTPEIGSTIIGNDGMTLLYVPAGEFIMGSLDKDVFVGSDETPQHTVYLDAFWIDQTEVANKQYAACVSVNQCKPPSNTSSYTHSSYYGNSLFDDYPVIYVDWDKAKAYCSWAGRRLPTEAEWEKAARGPSTGSGDGRIYPWGNAAPNKDLLNYNAIVGDTTKVGSYKTGKSFYGAYDMAGNVWEWVNDWYQSGYYATLGDHASNPQGASSGYGRVVRGNSWFENNSFIRSADRDWIQPTNSDNILGFRCARNATP